MLFSNQIRRIKAGLKELKEDLTSELEQLPEGYFYSYESRGTTNYCERFPKGGNRKKEYRKGVKSDPVKLNMLVRKEYVIKALKRIDEDLLLLDQVTEKYLPVDENSVMEKFINKYPDLEEGIYRSGTDSESWKRRKAPEKLFLEEGLKSTAADGSKRRSLGELIIGSRLDHYNIPYVFEAPFAHPDLKGRFSPDFTIRRPRDGKIIYWEHLGRVTDEEYLNYNKYKFDVYEKYGIVPWDNLIVSFSQADNGINEKLIDALIQGWLL